MKSSLFLVLCSLALLGCHGFSLLESLQVNLHRYDIAVKVNSSTVSAQRVERVNHDGLVLMVSAAVTPLSVPAVLNSKQLAQNHDELYYSVEQLKENATASIDPLSFQSLEDMQANQVSVLHGRLYQNPNKDHAYLIQTVTGKDAPLYVGFYITQYVTMSDEENHGLKYIQFQMDFVDLTMYAQDCLRDMVPTGVFPVFPKTVECGMVNQMGDYQMSTTVAEVQITYRLNLDTAGALYIFKFTALTVSFVAAAVSIADLLAFGTRGRSRKELVVQLGGNFLYLIFGGLAMWLLFSVGVLLYTVFTFQIRKARILYRLVPFWIAPFGKVLILHRNDIDARPKDTAWLIFGGAWICAVNSIWIVLSAFSLIGIPLVSTHIKLCEAVLDPFSCTLKLSLPKSLPHSLPLSAVQTSSKNFSKSIKNVRGDYVEDFDEEDEEKDVASISVSEHKSIKALPVELEVETASTAIEVSAGVIEVEVEETKDLKSNTDQ